MSEDARDPIVEQPAVEEPQATAAAAGNSVTKEDLEIVNHVKAQFSEILKASGCILVPVTTIVNGRIFQAVEIMRRPKQSVIHPVKGGIVTP